MLEKPEYLNQCPKILHGNCESSWAVSVPFGRDMGSPDHQSLLHPPAPPTLLMAQRAGPRRLRVSSPALKDILQSGGLGAEEGQPWSCVLNRPFLSEACLSARLPCPPQDIPDHQPDHQFQKCIAREGHIPFTHLLHKYLCRPH